MTQPQRNKMLSLGFASLFSVSLALLPLVAVAALVPCGGVGQDPCTYCHLLQLGKNIIDFLMSIIFPLVAAMIVVGGFFIMTAREKPAQFAKGKAIITAAVVGILIALLAWLILDTIFKIVAPDFENITFGGQKLGPWHQLKCL